MSDEDDEKVTLPLPLGAVSLPSSLLSALMPDTHMSLKLEDLQRYVTTMRGLPAPDTPEEHWWFEVDPLRKRVAFVREGVIEGLNLNFLIGARECGPEDARHWHAAFVLGQEAHEFEDPDEEEGYRLFATAQDAIEHAEAAFNNKLREVALALVNKSGGTDA